MVMAADIAVWYITAAQRVKRISIKEREDPCTGGLEGGGESSWGGGGGGDLIGAATGNPLVIALPDPATVPRPRYTGRAAEGAQTHYCFSLIFILYVLPFIPLSLRLAADGARYLQREAGDQGWWRWRSSLEYWVRNGNEDCWRAGCLFHWGSAANPFIIMTHLRKLSVITVSIYGRPTKLLELFCL